MQRGPSSRREGDEAVRLQGKVALVCGASGRIGQTVALLFAQEGAAVALNARRAEALEPVREAITGEGGRALALPADVTEETGARAAAARTVAAFGRLDVLVYAVGGYLSGDLASQETSEADWDTLVRLNLKGAFLATKHALPEMARGGGGSAVLLSASRRARRYGNVAYSAAKEGLLGLVLRLAQEYRDQNVRVNALLPYSVSAGPERLRITPRAEPVHAGGLPEDIAYAALFLASDEARFITGVALPVDGGSDR
ncbi:MAG: SDR family oxidoreductase [Chloroflexi bacterium]|nr:SDR family oxidoreductase [Chloroflexota bacterium]